METLLAVPVNEHNRLKDAGPEREIEVGIISVTFKVRPDCHLQGWTAFDFPGRGGKVTDTNANNEFVF
jgi:hypothetical protein